MQIKKTVQKMRGINVVLLLILFVSNSNSFLSQYKNRCSSVAHKNSRRSLNPLLKISDSIGENQLQFKMNENSSLKRGKLFIPVVVHVIWNTPDQNISDEQIQSQIDVLNHDYGRRNSDLLPENHPFYKYGGGLDIHFFLAERDPNNRVSSGIVRVKTTITEWQDNDEMKSTNTGGSDYWDSRKYLNIYVVKFNNDLGLLGFAWPPSDLSTYPETDGVVIDFRAFGTNGTAGSEDFNGYALGRTTTHEVGHWLNLNHIWGDQACGDDLISDTPIAEDQNKGNPSFPWRPNNKCGANQNGEMFMNYMDYVYDNSMNMFTKEQVKRMYNSVVQYRSELIKGSYCSDLNIDGDSLFCEGSNSQFKVNRQRGNWIVSDTSKIRIDQNGYANLLKPGFVTISYILDSTSACPGLTATKNIQIEGKFSSQILQDKDTLMVLTSDETVGWINCLNDSLPLGTLYDNKFIPLKSGVYSAVVTSRICKDTTDCFSIQLLGNSKIQLDNFSVFPNPANNILYFKVPDYFECKVRIMAITGEILEQLDVTPTRTSSPLNLVNGVYLLQVETSEGTYFTHRLVVER